MRPRGPPETAAPPFAGAARGKEPETRNVVKGGKGHFAGKRAHERKYVVYGSRLQQVGSSLPPAPPPATSAPPSTSHARAVLVDQIGERGLQSLKMSSPPAPGASRRERHGTSDPAGSRWASLHKDLVGLVASRLLAGDFLDYVRFRAVCTGWRSGTASPRGRGVADPRFHPRRWMMFPEGHFLYPGCPELHGYVRFLNLDTGTLVRVNIPLLGDHCAVESVDGLLLLLRHPDQHREGTVRLLNPFTGDIAELPPLGPLIPQLGLPSDPEPYTSLTNAVCASVSFNSGVMTIMLALYHVSRFAYATSLDQKWTLASWKYPMRYPLPLSFQGKLYIIDTPISSSGKNIHQVFEIDPPVQDGAGAGHEVQPPKLIATIPEHKLVYPDGLVQCGSEILVLGHNDFHAPQILVCKLKDLVLQRFTPIKNIGGNTLFLQERNISVSSKILPTVKGDNIIYTRSGLPYFVQYHLSSGTLSPAIDNCCLYGNAPGPTSLVLHIFSCCIRKLWNRGLMFRRITESCFDQTEQDYEEETDTWPPVFEHEED